MDAKAAINYAKSVAWNVDTPRLIECVSKGIDVGSWCSVRDGWALVSRHAAGKESAWVRANKMRRQWPNLETKVVGTEGKEWKAEIWVRVRKP